MAATLIRGAQWRTDNVIALRFGDGRVIGFPAPEGFEDTVRGMSMVEYRPWAHRLIFERKDGLTYDWEVGSPQNWAPLRGRPVVYLDQNQWSMLSKRVFAPHRVPRAEDGDAAIALARLADARRVILPFSAAHLSETGAWSNDRGRQELADTVLSGSRGWQMRDPLEIRAAEFRAVLRASAGLRSERLPDVFTLEPYAALHSTARDDRSSALPDAVPEDWGWVYQALLSSVV